MGAVLFNEAHDLSSGVMVDKVYEDSLERYDHARQLGERFDPQQSDSIIARVDTSGKGVPIVVFNTLGWSRSDIAEVDVPFSDPGVQKLHSLIPGQCGTAAGPQRSAQ